MEKFSWPDGQQCAVSLTYDDGLPVHYEVVGPLLIKHGFRATFNAMMNAGVLRHVEKWRKLAQVGHELGNHSIFHPCRNDEGDRKGIGIYDLCNYTLERMENELELANHVLNLIDGNNDRTFGNTCCDITVGKKASEMHLETHLIENGFLADDFLGPCNP